MIGIPEQMRIIAKGAAEIINIEDLTQKLEKAKKENRPLIVKLGLDPSAPDIHLGHAVVLRKMKQLQDLGHKAVIIIGDFTGMIGDPTGKSKSRKQLTKEEVLENAKTYEDQIFKILDKEKTELRFNSEWLSSMNFKDVVELSAKYTVARMLEREDFKNRFNTNLPIGVHEFFYPLMQGYDSVAIKADIELGGTDQRFNILMGRTLQKDYGQECQAALFMPLLEGLDGVEKMSKSLGNYIGINEEPKEIFIKAMQISDSLIVKYFELTTDIHPDEVDKIRKSLEVDGVNPRDIKMRLAKELVRLYHGEEKADRAEEYFVAIFQSKEVHGDIDELVIEEDTAQDMIKVILKAKAAPSSSEAKRLVTQGGVKINGEKVLDFRAAVVNHGDLLQIGKKKLVKIIFG